MTIPQEIKDKYQTGAYRSYLEAFAGGYSLAVTELEAKDKRIAELEAGLRDLRHGIFQDAATVNQFIDQLLK